MRILLAIFVALVCCQAIQLQEQEYQTLFTKWVSQHSKNYELESFFKRYTIFKQNLDFINTHNSQNHSFEMGMNQFGDLSFEEFSSMTKGRRPSAKKISMADVPPLVPTPPLVGAGGSRDWRTGTIIAVNAVQDQGQCGSCYSFSAIASVEGAYKIKNPTLTLPKLSEQQVVDCSRSFGNAGCSGGIEQDVFKYIISNKGVTSKANYPYTGRDTAACRASSFASIAKITSYKDVIKNNEADLMAAVNKGPVSIAIDASHSFQFYTRGVFDDPRCGVALDHAVNAVGYGTDSATGKDFWIVRNSWGASWGESGYIRMVRNKNMCGLVLDASYPIA
jgi:C1A family cysteine protease